MPRKRTYDEIEVSDPPQETKPTSLVHKIRNMWEFASVMQFIFMFGKAIKIDEDFDIEDFENECLKPGYSEKLEEIGLTLLKWISSHRGLNFDIWDEYTRRQYRAKAEGKPNPYGDEEEPNRFRNFDILTKIRVLHQLTVWTLHNPDRIRALMPEQKDSEQTEWRMNIFGWDDDDREYYVLDDNRLYRRTEPPPPPAPKPKPKATSLKAKAARRRVSKRRKIEDSEADTETHDEEETSQIETTSVQENKDSSEIDTFGGYKWECVAITLDEYENFIASLRTKPAREYPNERAMRDRLNEEVMPVIHELAEKQRRKQERRERELMLMEKMAGAKRSSRLAGKQEKEQKDREEAEAARKKAADLAAAHRDIAKQEQMEQERKSRMMTREQRIKDREYKRLLMEEELARDAEEQKKIEEGEKRGSERHIRDRIEKNKKELEELVNEEDWTFDCSGCGMYGKNLDDGSHSLACEKCNVWQHSKCLGISKAAAEKEDFSFVCQDCRRKEEEASRPKIMLKFHSGQSSSPPQQPAEPNRPAKSTFVGVEIPRGISTDNDLTAPNTNGHRVHTSASSSLPSAYDAGNAHSISHGLEQRPLQSQSQTSHFADGSANGHVLQPSLITPAVSFQSNIHQNTHSQPQSMHRVPQHSSQSNGVSSQQYTNQQTPSIQSTPRQAPMNGQPQPFSSARRLPSPIVNRPKMSPTQGNHDVGPIAGIPNSSPPGFHPALFTPQSNGQPAQHSSQTTDSSQQSSSQPGPPSSPTSRISHTPQAQQLSGLSPVKNRVSFSSSYLPPSAVTDKQVSMSPPALASAATRSISATPIFPPAENLAPSPQQLHKEPVPTPSKPPLMPGESMEGIETHNTNGH